MITLHICSRCVRINRGNIQGSALSQSTQNKLCFFSILPLRFSFNHITQITYIKINRPFGTSFFFKHVGRGHRNDKKHCRVLLTSYPYLNFYVKAELMLEKKIAPRLFFEDAWYVSSAKKLISSSTACTACVV